MLNQYSWVAMLFRWCCIYDNRAIKAAQQAINSPLIEASIEGAKGIL